MALNFNFTVDPLPEGWQGTPAEFAQYLADSLHAEADGDLPVGVIGTVRPTEDQGVFFNTKDGSVEYWSEDKGRYVVASDVPIGGILPIASKARGAEPPPFYLYCDGSEVLKTDYPDLHDEIGDIWGDASDADHFRLPSLSGRVIIAEGKGTYNPVAAQVGSVVGDMEQRDIGTYFGKESVGTYNKPPGTPSAGYLTKLTSGFDGTGSKYTGSLQPAVVMLYIIRAK